MSNSIEDILKDRQICICAGSGGVGKTTTSAAIALGMAARGHKVCVLTIDPAKRLADSLGLTELGNEATQVDPKLLKKFGVTGKAKKGLLNSHSPRPILKKSSFMWILQIT